METTCAFSLQYDRVGRLENCECGAQRIDTVNGRPIDGIDDVSRERPLALVSSVGFFTCNDNSESIAQRRKHPHKRLIESES
jgi:hypothetical protein